MCYVEGLVSVVIPTYRRSEMVVRAVSSVLSQSYPHIECLVVNDNEKDDEYSAELYSRLGSFIQKKEIILVEQDYHKNGAAARNCGIKKAKGEYIAFLDDDDWWEGDKIAKQIDYIKKQNLQCGAVSTLATYFKGNYAVRKTSSYRGGKIYKEIMAREFDVITCSLLMKHRALDETGYFDENLKRHQEIQLLSYFTEKYELVLLPEYLTCVSVDDAINRPSSAQSLEIKRAFFESVEPILNRMRASDRRYVKYMHIIELMNLYLKERRFDKLVIASIRLLTCPRAFIKSIRRVMLRINETVK